MDPAPCPACGAAVLAPGQRFCASCGAALVRACPRCGAAALRPDQRYCADCGATLLAGPAPEPAAAVPGTVGSAGPAPPPEQRAGSERHLVSVLFVDLVGFTSLAEGRDPEDVRELLSGYFDLARRAVTRHGGVLEKFIGDEVRAVWGAGRATEDQAERAVRAALEIVTAVPAYGETRGTGELAARAGVGSGAVATWAAQGEGLVAGDLVNTAARIQAAGGPGQVLTDAATWAAARVAIGFADAGTHVLKGKADPQALYRALRVVAGLGGEDHSLGQAIPLVGRARELATLKELYHTTAEERRARLILLLGPPGVGKSRLAAELGSYLDGLSATVLWHTGRCLAYGEGVAFYALAQVVRGRLGLLESDDAAAATAKLETGLAAYVPDLGEQAWVGPALAVLLGLPTTRDLTRDELFAGWRLFLERLAQTAPSVVWVDDAQWADPGLLDFLDHLLDWSGEHPLLLILSGRPELLERRPDLGSRRAVTPLWVQPLPPPALSELIEALVPGCPLPLRDALRDRSEGIPLFVTELLRALHDQGFLRATDEGSYTVLREPDALALPVSLTTLLAARLDALDPDERRLATALSVFAGAFPAMAAGAIGGQPPEALARLLAQLVRKEVLVLRADRLSPERGQYAFGQQLFRQVAYELLTRSERKAHHLAAATHLEATFAEGGAEVAEAVAIHRFRALEAALGDPDETPLREAAGEAFARAAQRAAELGAPEAALAASQQALALAVTPAAVARHAEAAGEAALDAGQPARAAALFDQAAAIHAAADRVVDAGRVTTQIANSLTSLGRPDEAIARLSPMLAALEGPGAANAAVRAAVHAQLGGALVVAGRGEEAGPLIETALSESAALELPRVLSTAANGKAIWLSNLARIREAEAYYRLAADTADAAGLFRQGLVVRSNLTEEALAWDVPSGADQARAVLAEARRLGLRQMEASSLHSLGLALLFAGCADEAAQLMTEALGRPAADDPGGALAVHVGWCRVLLAAWRGEPAECRDGLARLEAERATAHAERRLAFLTGEVATLMAEGQPGPALQVADGALAEAMGLFGLGNIITRQLLPDALEAALGGGDPERVDRLLAPVLAQAPGRVPPYLRAQVDRFRARLAAARGDEGAAAAGFTAAEDALSRLGYPYWLARARLDHAEWLAAIGRPAASEPLARAAITALTDFSAWPWADRARAIADAGSASPDAPRPESVGARRA